MQDAAKAANRFSLMGTTNSFVRMTGLFFWLPLLQARLLHRSEPCGYQAFCGSVSGPRRSAERPLLHRAQGSLRAVFVSRAPAVSPYAAPAVPQDPAPKATSANAAWRAIPRPRLRLANALNCRYASVLGLQVGSVHELQRQLSSANENTSSPRTRG